LWDFACLLQAGVFVLLWRKLTFDLEITKIDEL